MKTKILNIVVLIFLITSLHSCKSDRTGIIDVKFTSELTKDDLNKIKADLASQNIDLTYDQLTFDEEGKLKMISASIDYNDGLKSSITTRELKSTDGPGFYRDFSDY
jgi:hypothetical protein